MKIVLDTETCHNNDTAHVWLWGMVTDVNEEWGTSVEELCYKLRRLPKEWEDIEVYFHNLKYDGHYIADAFLRAGMEFVEDRQQVKNQKHFTAFIDGSGNWYSLTFMDWKRRKIQIWDSLKKIPLSVQEIAKAYDLQDKGCIDYTEYKEVGYTPTQEEIDYCLNDCRIVHQALKIGETQNLNKMTIGADCMAFYQMLCGGRKAFFNIFPNLDEPHKNWTFDDHTREDFDDVSRLTVDSYCRQAYKGAFCYVNPNFKNKEVGPGQIFDVNSLYPYVMATNAYPIGYPHFGYGEPPWADGKGYIFRCKIKFELKKQGVPCIIERNHVRFMSATSWIGSSNDEYKEMYFTNIDYDLIKENYIFDIEFVDYMEFTLKYNLFTHYINYWNKVKEQATKDGNAGLRTIAKLYNNNLYGKFGQNNDTDRKGLTLSDDVVVTYKVDGKARKTIYSPVAAFCTAYARAVTITAAKANYNRFCYADTDSIHIVGDTPPINIEIDNVKLGAWKKEGSFTNGKYLRQKTYMETINGELHIICAGLKKNIVVDGIRYSRNEYYEKVLCLGYDDFCLPDNGKKPLVIKNGRTIMKTIQGGLIIKNADFTLW